ncbi:MAG: sulfatase-like hydrolase/transferase, partial [Anaerohalosphaera sp.]|nr:sulfatase-like hydrolase/transferase [Anaerohalosphaera sp.]
YDNTLIIFTSDNGGQLDVGASNGALTGSKGEMLEGGIKVPFCAVWPNRINPKSCNKETMMLTMDIFPTVCAAAGAGIEHTIDGTNYLPLLLGQRFTEPDRCTIWVRREGWQTNGRAYYCARYKQYKLLQKNSPFEEMELYDLDKDPKETTPLPKDHPMYEKLFLELQKHIVKAGAVPWHE